MSLLLLFINADSPVVITYTDQGLKPKIMMVKDVKGNILVERTPAVFATSTTVYNSSTTTYNDPNQTYGGSDRITKLGPTIIKVGTS